MIIAAGDLSVYIDTGTNDPGQILERLEGDSWRRCLVNGKPLKWPVRIDTLPPGKYRAVSPN